MKRIRSKGFYSTVWSMVSIGLCSSLVACNTGSLDEDLTSSNGKGDDAIGISQEECKNLGGICAEPLGEGIQGAVEAIGFAIGKQCKESNGALSRGLYCAAPTNADAVDAECDGICAEPLGEGVGDALDLLGYKFNNNQRCNKSRGLYCAVKVSDGVTEEECKSKGGFCAEPLGEGIQGAVEAIGFAIGKQCKESNGALSRGLYCAVPTNTDAVDAECDGICAEPLGYGVGDALDLLGYKFNNNQQCNKSRGLYCAVKN